MGFLANTEKARIAEIHPAWKVLKDEGQIEEIIADSVDKPVVIFKHSISCGLSSMVKFQLETSCVFDKLDFDFYYLDLITNRPISNKVANQFGIRHQSPQILIIRNGKVVFDMSHHQIQGSTLRKGLEKTL